MGERKLGICFSPAALWRPLSHMAEVEASVPLAQSEHSTFPFSLQYVISEAHMSQFNVEDIGVGELCVSL